MYKNNFWTKRTFLFFTVLSLAFASTFAQESKHVTNVPDSIKWIPSDVTVFVGTDILGGENTREILLANPFLSATKQWQIFSYQVTFVRIIGNNGVEDPPIRVLGANFPEEVISKIKSAPSGTVIEFTNIKAINAEGMRRSVKTFFMVRIK